LELKQSGAALQKAQDDLQRHQSALSHGLKQSPWIIDNEHLFGQSGTAFDFAACGDISEMRSRMSSLEEQHGRLRKTINVNVMDMIDRYGLAL
jgi:hypothetical protein